jgi:hypothetical protein
MCKFVYNTRRLCEFQYYAIQINAKNMQDSKTFLSFLAL